MNLKKSAVERPENPEEILNRIREGYTISKEELEMLAYEVDNIVHCRPVLRSISDGSFLHHITNPNKTLIKRWGFLSPKALFLSKKIKSLCRLPYPRKNGEFRACGGIEKNYLACSPYSPNEMEMRNIIASGNIFCFLQADGLTDMLQQRHLGDILLETEKYLQNTGVKIIMSFAAGPCRVCKPCAGELGEQCYKPDKKRFSLEACGIDVDWAMKIMALKTEDSYWKIEWLKDFGLNDRQNESFKSVAGMLLLTNKNMNGG